MTTPQPISFVTATADFGAGKDTPRDLLERCLARVEEFEPAVGAFVCHDIAAARSAADRSAERWRAGRPLSPIDGMPLGIKDIIETADMATEQGSPLFVGRQTGRDAASVTALREAGAVILGKVVTTEFASTEPRGTRNPWDSARTPGGSSSGSAAAVACGMVPAALGTQVVGSILRPASFCGCVGFKPSVGGINRGGSYDYFSQSCTGVLAASLENAWLAAINIVERAGGDPGYPGLRGPPEPPPARCPRAFALLRTVGWEDASLEARRAFEAAVARLAEAGIAIADHHAHPAIEEVEGAIADAAGLTRQINAWEGRWPLNTYRNRDRSKLSQSTASRISIMRGRANTTMVNVVGANATYHQPNFAEHEFINGKIVDLARVVSHWAHEAKSASDVGVLGAMAARYARIGAGKICTVVAPTNCHWDPAVAPPVPAAPMETPKVSPQTIQEVVALLANGQKTGLLLGSHALYGDGLELAGRIAAKTGADLLGETTPSRLARGQGRVTVEKIPYLPRGSDPVYWVKLAEAQGVPATRATTAEEFHKQFDAAMSTNGPRLIEAQIVQNLQPMSDYIHDNRG